MSRRARQQVEDNTAADFAALAHHRKGRRELELRMAQVRSEIDVTTFLSPAVQISWSMWLLSPGDTTEWAAWVLPWKSSSMSSAVWFGSSHSMLVTANCLAASCSWSS